MNSTIMMLLLSILMEDLKKSDPPPPEGPHMAMGLEGELLSPISGPL